MRTMLQYLLGIRVKITPGEAIEIARKDCVRRGLPFLDPVACTEKLRHYVIASPAGQKGGVVFVKVSVTDGMVLNVVRILR